MKKIISLVIIAAMLVSLLPCFAITIAADTTANTAITPDTSWYTEDKTNTAATTYTISTPAQLLGFAQILAEAGTTFRPFSDDTILLDADIDLNPGWDANNFTEAPVNVWPTLRSYFAGTFDGQGHTIKGIYQINTDAQHSGIFGSNYGRTITVKNLTVLNSYSKGEKADGHGFFVGALTTASQTVFDNVYLDARIVNTDADGGDYGVGGFVGGVVYNGGSKFSLAMKNCVFAGSIEINPTVANSSTYVGGFLGRHNEKKPVTFENCAFYGTIKGTVAENVICMMGGIIGYQSNNLIPEPEESIIVKNCISAGTYAVTTTSVGAVYGTVCGAARWKDNLASKTTFDNVLYTGDASLLGCAYIQGNIADIYTATSTANTYYADSIKGTPVAAKVTVAEITGITASGLLISKGFSEGWVAVADGLVLPRTIVEGPSDDEESGPVEKPLPELTLPESGVDTSWYDPLGSEFVLLDAADLLGFAYIVAAEDYFFEGKTVKLGADIDLNPGFDADAEEILAPDNLWPICNAGRDRFAGTFDGQGHTISGLYMFSDTERAGIFGVTGDGHSAIVRNLKLVNSYVESNQDGVGAIFGTSFGAVYNEISNVYADVNIKCNATKGGMLGVGGLIGGATWNNADVYQLKIDNCVYAGDITVSFTENAYTQSGLPCGVSVGGIVGFHNATSLVGDIVTANITNTAFYGKIKGIAPMDGNIGGLIGSTKASKMSFRNCISAGSIEIVDATVGFIGSLYGNCASADLELINVLYTGEIANGGFYVLPDNCSIAPIADVATVKGSAASAVLTANSMTDWSATEAGYPLPTALVTIVGDTEVPAYPAGAGVLTATYEDDGNGGTGEGEGAGEGDGAGDGEGDQTETQAPAPETQAPAETTTKAPKEKKGCASVVFGGFAMTLLIAGAAVTVVKKKQ